MIHERILRIFSLFQKMPERVDQKTITKSIGSHTMLNSEEGLVSCDTFVIVGKDGVRFTKITIQFCWKPPSSWSSCWPSWPRWCLARTLTGQRARCKRSWRWAASSSYFFCVSCCSLLWAWLAPVSLFCVCCCSLSVFWYWVFDYPPVLVQGLAPLSWFSSQGFQIFLANIFFSY